MSHIIELKIHPAKRKLMIERRRRQLQKDFDNLRYGSLLAPVAQMLYRKMQDELNEVESALLK